MIPIVAGAVAWALSVSAAAFVLVGAYRTFVSWL